MMHNLIAPKRIVAETVAVFGASMAFLMLLAPSAPFTKELGVCESGAVRDVLAGNMVLPHFGSGPMVHVPPLYWWTAALCVKVLGWSELALRLPALVPAALTCAVIFAWSGASIGRRAGLWAAAALLLCHFFLDAARQPRMDAMLALFVTIAIVCLERALSSRRTGWFVLAALAIGLGSLSKGILGVALPGVTIALFLAVRRRFWDLFRLDLVATFTAGLAIGLAWYAAAYNIGGRAFLAWQVGMNLWSRFIPTSVGGAGYCAHPFWYFVPATLSGFLPWSLFLPAAGAALWARRKHEISEPVIFAACWFAAILVFFSASQGKCLIYILPAFPPLAVLTGWTIADARTEFAHSRWTLLLYKAAAAIVAGGAGLAVIAACIAIILGTPDLTYAKLHPTDRRFLEIFAAMAERVSPALIIWILISGTGAILIVFGIRQRSPSKQAFGTLIVAGIGSWFWFAMMSPALAERETLKPFAREVMEIVPPDAPITHVGMEDCDLFFYATRPIEEAMRFSCSANPATPRFIVIRQKDLARLPVAQRACLKPVASSGPVDGNGPRLLLEDANADRVTDSIPARGRK
jgi:4-amino-4-deoxy-L-arabinose transferase-like glycosyltransferase